MRCEELMKSEVLFLTEGQTVQQAARLMRDHNIGFLPICTGEGRVSGTLTDRDIAVRVTAEALAADATPVEQVMTREVIACSPQDDLAQAQQLMAAFQKSRILVVDDQQRLRGVISLSDVAKQDTAHRASLILRHVAWRESHA